MRYGIFGQKITRIRDMKTPLMGPQGSHQDDHRKFLGFKNETIEARCSLIFGSVWKTLNSNDLNQVADRRFSLKQWFAAGAHSCRRRKTCSATRYLRISENFRWTRPEPGSYKS